MPGFHEYSPLFTLGLLSRSSSPVAGESSSQVVEKAELTRTMSFLDLADSYSLKRKGSDATASTWSGRRIASLTVDTTLLTIPQPKPTSRRPSRENLRQLPAAKPAPSLTLPAIPVAVPTPVTRPRLHRPSFSDVCSPTSPSLPDSPTFTTISRSMRSLSITSSVKRRNRSDALDCLEGRTDAPNRFSRRKQNFMSMSDDEDDEPVDNILPLDDTDDFSLSMTKNEERNSSIVAIKSINSSTFSGSGRRRSRTIESWFPPLTNFLDFKEDDAPSWRSFVEITQAV